MIQGVRQYAQTQVQTASGVQLIVLLYDGMIQAMKLAQQSIRDNNSADKARFLDRALRVVGELSAVLDLDRGGVIAKDLQRIYEYVQYQLLQANLAHDGRHLDAPIKSLSVIREAWQELAERGVRHEAIGQ
ncbi:MAG: flagellar export chaperone FliS [Nitrospirae bacterium]|nr:MAG: flagellar export chaperone FliS [Nitrospirota bacterium]